MPTKPKVTRSDVGRAIIRAYLALGRDVTVAEIAATLGANESQVRSCLPNGTAPTGTMRTDVERAKGRCPVYGATRETLLGLLRAAQSPQETTATQ